jgi:hypothetical protein
MMSSSFDGCGAIAEPDPDHFRWRAPQDAQLLKVIVFSHEHKTLRSSTRPDGVVASSKKAQVGNMC